MLWYVIICILMLYPLSVVCAGNISGKKTQCVALMIACFVLWFFMAMRSTLVGVDTKYYSYIFTQFSDIPFHKVFTTETFATADETWSLDFEYGYRLYNKLVSVISCSPQTIIICNSMFIIILLYYFIKKSSLNFMLSIWLYITLGIFQTEMNVTRNAIAILIVYNAFCFLKQRRIGPYIIVCIIATLFHKATLVFIPLYWLIPRIKWSRNRMTGCVILSVIAGIVVSFLAPYLRTILPSGLSKYFTSSNSKMESVVVGVFYLLLFLVIYVCMNKQERLRIYSESSVGTTMFMFNLCCFGLSSGIGYAARMAALFGPYMITYVPELLGYMESESKKKNMTGMIAAICGCQYLVRLCINNIGGTMPYTFFW